MNPKETLSHLLHLNSGDPEDPQKNDAETNAEKPYSLESENLAIPEIRTKGHEASIRKREEEQNQSMSREEVVFDTLAIPEVHVKKRPEDE